MFGSLRAELLVLRKSKVAWALVLTAPLLTLVTTYLFQFLDYLGDTPAIYSTQGTPAQNLPALLPSQFVIQSVEQFYFTAPFIVLGAVIAGSDWSRGTIRTSLLAGPSRTRTFAGQVLAIMMACAISVLLCFALAAVASVAIRFYAGPSAPGAGGGNAAFPAGWVIYEGVGAGLVIGLAYGALGILLGTACRSAAGAVVAALAWYFLVESEFYQWSASGGPVLQHTYNAFPGASVITLTSMFGSSGGGQSSATYQPVGHGAAAAILLGDTAVFLGLALILVLRRDVVAADRARFARFWPVWGRARQEDPPTSQPTGPRAAAGDRRVGVLASARAELLVMSRWPAMQALVLVLPVVTLFNDYIDQYVQYLGGTGSIFGTPPSQVLPTMLPGQYVPAVLNSIGFGYTLPGTAAFFLIGALAAGNSWGDRTISTALLQAPGRVRTALGQAVAVSAALVASVVLTFVVAGMSTVLIAVIATGSASPASGPLPGAGRLAAAFGIAVVVSLAWGAVGWTAGTVLKSTAAAFAAMLLWTTIVEVQLDYYASEMPKAARAVYDILPDAATNTVALRFGQVDYGGPVGGLGEIAPLLAFGILAIYAVACFGFPVIMTRRRDIP
jgi:ABC-2 type transport system permease protein